MIATKRYYALFGPRASGKTVYLGALYGSGCDPADGGVGYHVSASEDAKDPTHAYLGRISRALKSGSWPDTTGFEHLEKMTFHFTSGDLARDVVLPDVGGELTQRAVDAAERKRVAVGLKDKILAEYTDYHGFLVFVSADPVDSARASEYKWEVDALLNALRERTPDGGTIARPIAILVTKWDLVEPGALRENSEAHAAAYVDETHPELAAGLKVLCRNLRVFPVSATGPTVGGLPSVPLRPTDLGAPIAWLIETSERVMLDRAIAYIDRNRRNLFHRDPDGTERRTYLQVAHGRLADFLLDVPHGPLADEARVHVNDLRLLSRARRNRWLSYAGLTLFILALGARGYRDNIEFTRASALLNNASPDLPPREVVALVGKVARESFLKHPVGYALFWWRRLRIGLENYRADYELRSFEGLERRSHPTDEKDARDLLDKIKDFQLDFPDSPRSAEVEGFKKTAEETVRSGAENRQRVSIEEDYKKLQSSPDDYELAKQLLDKCIVFLEELPASRHVPFVEAIRAEAQATVRTQERARDYAELQINMSKAKDAPWRCFELCEEFLKKDPFHPKADEVRRARDRYLRAADDKEWNGIEDFARNYPDMFRDQIQKADAYFANTKFTIHRDEALRFKGERLKRYDLSTYEAIRSEAREGGNHAETLNAVYKRCKDYLNSPITGKRMTDEVKHWVRWFDEWTTGRELFVRVASIRIDRGSIWHHTLSYSDPRVFAVVKVGPKRYTSSYKSVPLGRDVREIPDDRLGPFTWRWGDPEVSVALYHSGASPAELTQSSVEGDPFKVRIFNRLTSWDGGKIAVRLECPEVEPPLLPPYKED